MSLRALYTGTGRVVVEPAPAEVGPGPGEVAIAVAYTGLCGTDRQIYLGDLDARVRPPAVVGHEMSGTLAALGPGVDGWRVGDPVTVMPLVGCGSCAPCRAGNPHVCQRSRFLGIDADGALQQRWTVPADRLVALPAGLDLRAAALLEPTAAAVHDVARAGVRPGDHVVVVGGGTVGVLIGLVATEAGARVVVVEPDAERRAVATAAGLEVLDPGAIDVVADVHQWTGGAGAAVACEVSGGAAGVDTAVDVLGPRGRLCLVAVHAGRRELDLHRFSGGELTLVGARLYEPADWTAAVELTARGVVPADLLVSAVVPLADVDAAFEAVRAGTAAMKVLVDCRA